MLTTRFGKPDEPDTQRLDNSVTAAEKHICPKCSGAMVYAKSAVYPKARLLDPVASLYLEQLKGSWTKGNERSSCLALVCISCGYTEFYATNPKNLLES